MLRIDAYIHTISHPRHSHLLRRSIETFVHACIDVSMLYLYLSIYAFMSIKISKRFRQASSMRKNGPIRNPPHRLPIKFMRVKEKVEISRRKEWCVRNDRQKEQEKKQQLMCCARIGPVGSYFVIDSFSQIDKNFDMLLLIVAWT